jgi:transcriptional regulator with PAS, ATPase and Fis domain
MVKLNCAAFPQTMIEGELFGYVKGAFTGAMNDFPGMIAEADGSTLFLDEISDMPIDLQTRFLRVLQEREFRPLGSTPALKSEFSRHCGNESANCAGAGRESTALRSVLPARYFPD